MTPVLTIVGGGVSAAALIGLLPGALALDRFDIRLVAQDPDRLAVIAGHARALVAERAGWTVAAHRTPIEAAAGADVIVMMIRVGGLAARADDEDRSRAFGVPGDEGLGPGGAANARRTLPVLAELADDLVRVAPTAPVLNLVAPLGITTRLLLDRGLDAIGVCELPAVTESALIAAIASVADTRPPVDLAYAGLNHLGWFWPRSGSPSTNTEILAPAVAAGLVDPGVLGTFGAVPLKYYYWLFDPAAADRLGIARDPGRAEHLIGLRDRALAELAAAPGADSPALAGRPMPWFADGLVPMLAAILHRRPWQGFANVRNDGVVDGLVPELVVETRATLEGGRLRPEPLVEPMPPPVRAFVEQVAHAEDLLYRSWLDRDDELLVAALVDGPHHLDRAAAHRLAAAIHVEAPRPVDAVR